MMPNYVSNSFMEDLGSEIKRINDAIKETEQHIAKERERSESVIQAMQSSIASLKERLDDISEIEDALHKQGYARVRVEDTPKPPTIVAAAGYSAVDIGVINIQNVPDTSARVNIARE